MNEPQFDHGGASKPSRKLGRSSSGKPDGGQLVEEGILLTSSCPSPCGACKFLRRKCINGCIFAPYFGNDQGAAKFAAVHKVFGASNVSKLLLHIPASRRQDAVLTICYEAQARLSDPVYGCVSAILTLQHQVTTLQAELEMAQTQVINKRYAIANAFQSSQTIPQYQNIAALHPTYNLMNISSFNSPAAGFEFIGETAISNHFDPIQLHNANSCQEEEEDEEEGHTPIGFTTQIFD